MTNVMFRITEMVLPMNRNNVGGLCGTPLACTARGASRLLPPCRIGLVLTPAEKQAPDSCAPDLTDSSLNPLRLALEFSVRRLFLERFRPHTSVSLHNARYRTFHLSHHARLKLLHFSGRRRVPDERIVQSPAPEPSRVRQTGG
jgi:hypothetical protein